jgi:hypothetical protein
MGLISLWGTGGQGERYWLSECAQVIKLFYALALAIEAGVQVHKKIKPHFKQWEYHMD